MTNDQSLDLEGTPTCGGTGLLALDIVMGDDLGSEPKLSAGGSFGNVMAILSFLGWKAFPVARLGCDSAYSRIAEDLKTFRVRTDLIFADSKVESPIILQRNKRMRGGGSHHIFEWRCPSCKAWFPRFRPVRQDFARQLLSTLPNMETFYFDRAAPGTLELAQHAGGKGSLVVFEPSGISDRKQFARAMELSHIVKYSHERLNERDILALNSDPWLLIETLGAGGLRYRLKPAGTRTPQWKLLPAVSVQGVVDTVGAGDWCSAGIIDCLGRNGSAALQCISEEHTIQALQYGQAMGALNCCFAGARGIMYHLSRSEFNESVENLLIGRYKEPYTFHSMSGQSLAAISCVCPGCQKQKESALNTKAQSGQAL